MVLHPYNSILFIIGLFILGRLQNEAFLLFFVFFVLVSLLFGMNPKFLFKPKLIFIFFLFFIFFYFANKKEGIFLDNQALIRGIVIIFKMALVFFITQLVIRKTYPEDFLLFLKKIGLNKILFLFGISFNIFPYFKRYFDDFYIRIKNADNFFKRVIYILKSPYVILSYSLFLIDDIYRAMLAREINDFVIYRNLKMDALNKSVFFLTVFLYAFLIL